MDLAQKVTLKQKGEKTNIPVHNIHAKIQWKSAVDMDLHVYYKLKPGKEPEKSGLFSKLLGGGKENSEGHIYFAKRGKRNGYPWIYLDQDAGVGGKGGDNEENVYFTDLSVMQHLLIVANIFNDTSANFADYDGKVILIADGREFEIPLTESATGSYCVIAHVDCSGDEPMLININKVQSTEPSINDVA